MHELRLESRERRTSVMTWTDLEKKTKYGGEGTKNVGRSLRYKKCPLRSKAINWMEFGRKEEEQTN